MLRSLRVSWVFFLFSEGRTTGVLYDDLNQLFWFVLTAHLQTQNRGCALESRGIVPLASDDMPPLGMPTNSWPTQHLSQNVSGELSMTRLDLDLLNSIIEKQLNDSVRYNQIEIGLPLLY